MRLFGPWSPVQFASAMYVAMPSFIHRSLQSSGVTVSPYHWCAISWTIVSRDRSYLLSPMVTIDCVSMALSDGHHEHARGVGNG